MTCLYSATHLDIYLLHNGARTALEVCWRNQAHGAQLREGSIQALLLARRHHVTGWLSNDQELGPLSRADAEWARTMLQSMLADLRVTRFALLQSAQPQNQQLLQPVLTEFATPGTPLRLQCFTNAAQARRWVLA